MPPSTCRAAASRPATCAWSGRRSASCRLAGSPLLRHAGAQRPPRPAHPRLRRGRPPPGGGGVQGARPGPARSLRDGRAAGRVGSQHQGGAVSDGAVTVIDYGAGNLASLTAGLRRLGGGAGDRRRRRGGSRPRLVLPGVGAAGPARRELHRRGSVRPSAGRWRPARTLLGICLGMQLLFERSDEGEPTAWAAAGGSRCDRLVAATAAHGLERRRRGQRTIRSRSALPAVCYFAHSFAVRSAERRDVVADHRAGRAQLRLRGGATDTVAGAQFHPETQRRGGRGAARAATWTGRMLRRRIIPCLDVRGGRLVKGVRFQELRDCGDPVEAARGLRPRPAPTRSCGSTSLPSTSSWHALLRRGVSRRRARWTCR